MRVFLRASLPDARFLLMPFRSGRPRGCEVKVHKEEGPDGMICTLSIFSRCARGVNDTRLALTLIGFEVRRTQDTGLSSPDKAGHWTRPLAAAVLLSFFFWFAVLLLLLLLRITSATAVCVPLSQSCNDPL